MIEIITAIENNIIFGFIVSIFGILGFLLSLFIAIRSNSISKELRLISIKSKYNRNRKILIDKFSGYRLSITEDSDYSDTLRHNLRTEVLKFEKQYKHVLTLRELITLKKLKLQLQNKKPNFKKICFYLDDLIARFNIKED